MCIQFDIVDIVFFLISDPGLLKLKCATLIFFHKNQAYKNVKLETAQTLQSFLIVTTLQIAKRRTLAIKSRKKTNKTWRTLNNPLKIFLLGDNLVFLSFFVWTWH